MFRKQLVHIYILINIYFIIITKQQDSNQMNSQYSLSMEEIFPLELKQKFKAKILKLELYEKQNHKKYFNCSTNFGQMTLLIEEIQTDSQSIKNTELSPYQFFKSRNKFLASERLCKFVPVIYQQYVIKTHKDKSTCFTLMEPIQLIDFNQEITEQQGQGLSQSNCFQQHQINKISQSNLILFANSLTKNNQFFFHLSPQMFQLRRTMRSIISSQLFFDFTCLKHAIKQKCNNHSQKMSQNLINNLQQYLKVFNLKKQIPHKIDQIIFLRDKIFKYSYQKLKTLQLTSWLTLAISLNILQDIPVVFKFVDKIQEGQQDKKGRSSSLKKLNGKNISLELQNQIISNLSFIDGICIDSLEEINYEDLVSNFFIKSSLSPVHYIITKQTYVMVYASETTQNQNKKQEENQQIIQNCNTDILIVKSEVNKLQCINFFITYLKYIDPIVKSITFFQQENLLQFQFLNKLKKKRKIQIKFYEKYIIKDEQISMIIQKSRLDAAVLNLSKMSITDSFLLFLANSDKMKKIKHLDISYCQKITQNGVNSLLISPFCKKLQILNVSGAEIMDSSIQSLSLKANLSQLYLNNCKRLDEPSSQKIKFKNQSLHRLQAIGVNLQVCVADSLQYLKLTNQFPLQSLKLLKNLFLKELTIRLVDNKKNIMEIFGNFYGKQVNPVREFVQGNSAKTLKYLDISNSSVKIKNIRSLFHMPQLQDLKLNNIHKLNQIDFPISSNILSLSVENNSIKIKDLKVMLKNTKIMSKVSISNTQIGKFEMIQFIVQNKKFINTISLSEQQYTNKFIQKDKPILQFIQAIEVYVDRLIYPQMQYMLNQMLYKASKSNKIIRLIVQKKNQEALIKKVNKYLLTVNGLPLKNLYINSKSFKKIINTCLGQEDSLEQVVIHKPFIKPIKIQLKYKINQNKKIKLKTKQKNQGETRQVSASSMTKLTYLYKKIVNQHPDDIYEVSIKGNRTISQLIVKMLIEYSTQQKIKSLDFRNCVFSFMDIAQYIIDVPFLESVNNGEYELVLSPETFLQASQRYLKFFMRIRQVKKLKIIANQIAQADVLFSILYHIIDQHCEHLKQLHVEFNGIKLVEEGLNFWIRIFTLKNLKILLVNLNQCQGYDVLKTNLQSLPQICLPKLKELRMINFLAECIPPIKCNSLEQLQINLQSSSVTEQGLINILKPLASHLISLKINCSCCDMIVHPSKLIQFFKLAVNLERLVLSFQYCHLKDSSLFQFIQLLQVLKKLKYLELDVSYTINLLNQLVRSISNLHQNISKSYFKVFAINQFSKDFVFHKQELQSLGIQIIT